MSALPSIQARLSRVLVLASLGWALGVSAIVGWSVQHEIDELMDEALQESAEVLYGTLLAQLSALPPRSAVAPAGGAAMPAPPHEERLVWQLVGADGRLRLRSHQAPDPPLGPAGRGGLWSVDSQWRVYGLKFAGSGDSLFVAQRMSERRESRREAATITALLALLVGLGCASWLQRRSRRELQPLAALSAAVRAYDPIRRRVPLAAVTRSELQPIRDAILALAERLDRHVANERAVAAHAAHALRTPLAGLVAQLATAQRLSGPAPQPALQLARAAADRLRRVVAALLSLFRTGAELQWRRVDLRTVLAPLVPGDLQLELEGDTQVQADADLLAAALANLVDNSVRHGARTLCVRVRSSPRGTRLALQDDGQGCDPGRLAELRRALAEQRYEAGGGLGLMLADLVARAHGGRSELPDTATGFTVVLRFGAPPSRE